MKFRNLLNELLLEQADINGPNFGFLDDPDDGQDPDADAHAEGHEDEREDERNAENDAPMPINQRPNDAPPPAKKISRTQQIKAKWLEEYPGATEQQMNDAISFFYDRKDRLKPYKPYGTMDPTTGRYYINLPEIAALVERFPNMVDVLSNDSKLKDLGSYTWEEITFYQNRIYQQAIEVDDENWVEGDFTEDDRIRMALERWKKPFNRIINDGTLTVYRVDCKSEAIALGALDHAIFRKYKSEKIRKTLPENVRRYLADADDEWASQPWCIARPIGGQYGGNLWTNYRPTYGFYFILDNSKPEWDVHHISAIEAINGGDYQLSTMVNHYEETGWEGIEQIYPGLRGKRNLFPWFGETPREKKELTLDTITFRKGDPV